MASLTTVTRNALRAFGKHRTLWWFALPIGIFIGVGSYASQKLQSALPDSPDPSSWLTLFSDPTVYGLIGASLFAMLTQAIARGPLIAIFDHQSREMRDTNPAKTPWQNVFRAVRVSAAFELAYWTVLIMIGLAFVLPCLLAQRFNPPVFPIILELAFLLLLTLGVYLYFIKELSCLYALLGKVSFRSATDLGFRLFRRQAFNTVLFFFYAALLALFFSLFIQSLVRSAGLIEETSDLKKTIALSMPFGLYFVFDQLLRVAFFRAIASTPKKPAPKETVLETTQTPSGISPS